MDVINYNYNYNKRTTVPYSEPVSLPKVHFSFILLSTPMSSKMLLLISTTETLICYRRRVSAAIGWSSEFWEWMVRGWSEASNRVEADCATITIVWNTSFAKCYPKVSVQYSRRNVPRSWWRGQGLDRLHNYPLCIVSGILRFHLSTITLQDD
jgi:hypothetical protein